MLRHATLASSTQGYSLLLRYQQQCDLLGAHTLTLARLLRPMKLQATGGPAWRAVGLCTTHLLSDSFYILRLTLMMYLLLLSWNLFPQKPLEFRSHNLKYDRSDAQ